jgi:hypothetical protein
VFGWRLLGRAPRRGGACWGDEDGGRAGRGGAGDPVGDGGEFVVFVLRGACGELSGDYCTGVSEGWRRKSGIWEVWSLLLVFIRDILELCGGKVCVCVANEGDRVLLVSFSFEVV